MYTEQKPLFTLSVTEFIAIVRSMVEKTLEEREKTKNKEPDNASDEVLNIAELGKFLRCSKASIHNYKHLGLPFYRVGRKILFKKTEVLSFMKTLKGKNFIA